MGLVGGWHEGRARDVVVGPGLVLALVVVLVLAVGLRLFPRIIRHRGTSAAVGLEYSPNDGSVSSPDMVHEHSWAFDTNGIINQ